MKKHSLILHLGPCRTSTTYLFNVLLHNNQLNHSTQMNIPHSQIELYKWISQQKFPLDHPNAGSIYRLANNIKEDPSVNTLYSHTTTGHPLGPQTADAGIHTAIDTWLNRLQTQYTAQDLPHRLWQLTHNHQGDMITWLCKQLNAPHQHTSDTFTWGHESEVLHSDLPIVAFAPTLCHGGMFENPQYSVQQTTSTDDILHSIPHRQHKLRLFVNALSTKFHSVQLLIGLRDPTERINSWLNHLNNLNVMPPSESISAVSYTHSDAQLMRQWINSVLHIYSDMPTLAGLWYKPLPHNVTINTYHHNSIELNSIFPHISDTLNTNQPTLSSNTDNTHQLNESLLQCNYDAYHTMSQATPL